MFKVNFLVPGIEYEHGVSENSTLSLGVGTGIVYINDSFNDGVGFYPFAQGKYKYYYNFDRRQNKGKNTAGNTGNYVSLVGFFQSGEKIFGGLDREYSDTFGVGPVYGLQRTYNSGFNWSFEAGIMYASVKDAPTWFGGSYDYGTVFPWVGFTIGWVLGK